jgi:hypothetical protein
MNEQHAEVRKRMHETLDKLLDAADASGYDNEEVIITVQAFDVEEKAETDEVFEDISKFTAEFASGEIEEMYVEHTVFKNGVMQGEPKRQELPE